MDTHGHVLIDGQIDEGVTMMGTGFSEAVKGSNLTGSGLSDFVLWGGSEDGIDCVRGKSYRFVDGVIHANKCRTFITLKGGIDGAWLKDIRLSGKPRFWWDISLGDHTIYNKGKLMNTRGVVLDNVVHDSGRKVRVLCIDAEKPVLMRGKYRVIKIPKFLVWLWMKIKG